MSTALIYLADRPAVFERQLRAREAQITALVHAQTRNLLADLNVPLDYHEHLPPIAPRVPRVFYTKADFGRGRVDNSKPKRKDHRA